VLGSQGTPSEKALQGWGIRSAVKKGGLMSSIISAKGGGRKIKFKTGDHKADDSRITLGFVRSIIPSPTSHVGEKKENQPMRRFFSISYTERLRKRAESPPDSRRRTEYSWALALGQRPEGRGDDSRDHEEREAGSLLRHFRQGNFLKCDLILGPLLFSIT